MDFLLSIADYPKSSTMNLCLSAYGAGYMAAPFFATETLTSTLSFGNNTVASIYNCYGAPLESNFIGPFCHVGGQVDGHIAKIVKYLMENRFKTII